MAQTMLEKAVDADSECRKALSMTRMKQCDSVTKVTDRSRVKPNRELVLRA